MNERECDDDGSFLLLTDYVFVGPRRMEQKLPSQETWISLLQAHLAWTIPISTTRNKISTVMGNLVGLSEE
jgi:hypothetical protein